MWKLCQGIGSRFSTTSFSLVQRMWMGPLCVQWPKTVEGLQETRNLSMHKMFSDKTIGPANRRLSLHIANCITFTHPATIRLLLAVELLSNRLPNAHSNKLTTISTAARLIPSLNKRAIVFSD